MRPWMSHLASHICICERTCSVCKNGLFIIQNTFSESPMDALYRTCEQVKSHTWIGFVMSLASTICIRERICSVCEYRYVYYTEHIVWVTRKWIMSHVWISFSTHRRASCHESLLASYISIRERICSVCEEYMFTIQNTLSESHLNESCRTYERVFPKT